MKKTLLVTALLTAMAGGVAHAATNVTLYGVLDGGLGFNSKSTTIGNNSVKSQEIGFKGSNQFGNRWGMKGNEDLGNGTSATFQLESGFYPGTGMSAQGGRLFGRTATLGLTGANWGTFTVGQQANVDDDLLTGFDPFGTAFGPAGSQTTFGDYLSSNFDNTLKYLTPVWGGFQAGIAYSGNTKKVTSNGNTVRDSASPNTQSNLISVAASYNQGPIGLGLSYNRVKTYDSAVLFKAWNFGASYDLDVVKLYAMYGQQRDGISNDAIMLSPTLTAGTLTGKNSGLTLEKGLVSQQWLAGLSAPIGNDDKVMFSYQGATVKGGSSILMGDRVKANYFSLAYTHSLSKRTGVYAATSYGVTRQTGSFDPYKTKEVYGVVGISHHF